MPRVIRYGAYFLAMAAYVFFACGYLFRLLDAISVLPLFTYTVALIPICIIAAKSGTRFMPSFLYYLGLVYVGLLGIAIINHQQFNFDAPAGRAVSWEVQAVNSFALLVIMALLNLVPTGVVWGIAKAVTLQRKPS